MRNFAFIAVFVFGSFACVSRAFADAPTTQPVWPAAAPGEPSGIGPEKDQPGRITDVTVPTLSLYPAPAEKNTGVGILVCPGGGYRFLSFEHEGTKVAEWLNSIGVNAILLKYRVPGRKDTPNYLPALQDAQRAISIIRKNAADWKIDPKRIGMLGFSAGGNLAARVSTSYDQRAYSPIDDVEKVNCRPDFAILIYPGGILNETKDGLLPEIKVTSETPPMFLVQATDDPVNADNSVYMYVALKHAKVSAEMHLYAQGGHGFGMRASDHPVSTWPARCAEWMTAMKLLTPSK
jgi:acetyl esterase/lipase